MGTAKHADLISYRAKAAADEIIRTGINAMTTSPENADKAVEDAVGNLCVKYAGESKTPVFDALTVIAQRYVREMAMARSA